MKLSKLHMVLPFIINNPELHELYLTNHNQESKLWVCKIYTTLSTKRFPPNYGTMDQSTITICEIKKMLGGEE